MKKLSALLFAAAISQASANEAFYGADEILSSIETNLVPSSLKGMEFERQAESKLIEKTITIPLNDWNSQVRPLFKEALIQGGDGVNTILPRAAEVEKPDARAMAWMTEKTKKLFDVSWQQPNPYRLIHEEPVQLNAEENIWRRGITVEFFQDKTGTHGFHIEERATFGSPILRSTLEWKTEKQQLNRFVQEIGLKSNLSMTQESAMLRQKFPSQFSLRLVTPAAMRPAEDRAGLIGAIEIAGRELLPDFLGRSKHYPAYPSGQLNRLFRVIMQALQ